MCSHTTTNILIAHHLSSGSIPGQTLVTIGVQEIINRDPEMLQSFIVLRRLEGGFLGVWFWDKRVSFYGNATRIQPS